MTIHCATRPVRSVRIKGKVTLRNETNHPAELIHHHSTICANWKLIHDFPIAVNTKFLGRWCYSFPIALSVICRLPRCICGLFLYSICHHLAIISMSNYGFHNWTKPPWVITVGLEVQIIVLIKLSTPHSYLTFKHTKGLSCTVWPQYTMQQMTDGQSNQNGRFQITAGLKISNQLIVDVIGIGDNCSKSRSFYEQRIH